MKEKAIVFIESNKSGTGKIFLETARQMGYVPVILSADRSRYDFNMEIGIWWKIKKHTIKEIIDQLYEVQKMYYISGITSTSDYYIEIATKIAALKKLPCSSPDIIGLCRNKYKLRKKLKEFGFNTPKFFLIANNTELGEVMRTEDFPVVVKPVNGSGSSNVILCKNATELQFNSSIILDAAKASGQKAQALVEQFIKGEEYSVEIFNGKIIGITKKHLGKLPFFVETGHDFPVAGIQISTEIYNSIKSLIDILSLKFGPYHIEFKIYNDKFWLIEINPRLAGGYIPVLVKTATGIDMIRLTLKNLTGQPIKIKHAKKEYSSIRFIVPGRKGFLTNVSIPEAGISYELDYLVYKKIPFAVDKIYNDFKDRIGHIIVTGYSRKKTILMAENIIRKVGMRFQNNNSV